eukprot:COSAG06_NODE_49100_length_327_cov_1.649123_1_plen_65_part_10
MSHRPSTEEGVPPEDAEPQPQPEPQPEPEPQPLAFRMHGGEVARTAHEFLVGAKLSRYSEELLVS